MGTQKKSTVVAVSAGFDPVHIGHIRMFEEAKKLGEKLVVILNGDSWLLRKKGFVFMKALERKQIIESLSCVDEVYIHNSASSHVVGALKKIRPHVFANGGDRKNEADIPEAEICKQLGIQMVFNIGGGKVQSSSWLTDKAVRKRDTVKRPWGKFEHFTVGDGWRLKILSLKKGERLSLQSHNKRTEVWVVVEGTPIVRIGNKEKTLGVGDSVRIPVRQKHRISARDNNVIIVETLLGEYNEEDIVRYEDDYGRTEI